MLKKSCREFFLFPRVGATSFAQSRLNHQSIPAVPTPPPPGNRGAFAHVVSPGSVGIRSFIAASGAGH